ncbi:ATP-binding protein [Streptomyces sp. NPDC001222]|uniref:ATP-binding protein n=1 Tax=Streptomyces sp. NPDC001222 TaxID=3364548 RepID=UPI003689DE96
MDPFPQGESRTRPDEGLLRTTIVLDGGGACIADARHLTAAFLARVQAVHGIPVSLRAMDVTQLVVSELVTNARKYAPGPVRLELRVVGAAVDVTVWDSDPVLPAAQAPDPGRVGRHGLEIVRAVSQGFEVRREPVGKRVRARMALWDDPDGRPSGHPPL